MSLDEEDWVHELPTLELPVVEVDEPPFDPLRPPLRVLHAEPEVTSWQAVRETSADLNQQLGKYVALTFRVLAWLLDALRPLLPFGVLILLLAGLLSLVPDSSSSNEGAEPRRPAPTTTVRPTTTTTTEYWDDTTTTTWWDDTTTADGEADWPEANWDDAQHVIVVRP